MVVALIYIPTNSVEVFLTPPPSSFMAGDIEQLFRHLLAICNFSFENCQFSSLAHLFFELLVIWEISFWAPFIFWLLIPCQMLVLLFCLSLLYQVSWGFCMWHERDVKVLFLLVICNEWSAICWKGQSLPNSNGAFVINWQVICVRTCVWIFLLNIGLIVYFWANPTVLISAPS
jgi:hypothetical protein